MKALRALVIVSSLVLATSPLGALGAPVLLPLLWWASSSGGVAARWIASLAAGVVAAEAAVLATVLVVRGNGFAWMGASIDWSHRWLIPASVGVATAAIYVLTARRTRHRSSGRSLGGDGTGSSAGRRTVVA